MTHHDSKQKVNMPIISVVAILAIVFIVYLTLSFETKMSGSNIPINTAASESNNADAAGNAAAVANAAETVPYCKIIAGMTTIYDDTTLAVTLGVGESTYYSGHRISVDDARTDGCIITVSGYSEFLATGQVQKVGNLYITVKDAVAN